MEKGFSASKKLKELRQLKNVSLYVAATSCGITPQALTQYESGARVPRDEIKISLAKYYGVTVGQLFFGEG